MKKTLLYLSLPLILLGLSSCDSSDSSLSSGNNPNSDSSKPSDSSTQPSEDFTIKTSDNGLSASASSFTFAAAETGDDYPPDATISLTTDQTWTLCTGLNENYTKIIIENETVLPKDAIEMDLVLNNELVGPSGSNDIEGIDLNLDRKLIQPGDTKLKLEVRPLNGSSSITKTTTICVDVHIKQFG